MSSRVLLSVFSATAPKNLTKSFILLSTGKLKKVPGGVMSSGAVDTVALGNIADLPALIASLGDHQALGFGICGQAHAQISTTGAIADNRAPAGAIARSNKHFGWSAGPGLLLLDIDLPEGAPALLDHASARAALIAAAPALATAPMVISDSASSHIYRSADGEQMRGAGRCHVFVLVADATEIPMIGAELARKMRGAGHVYDVRSASGAHLERTLIDTAVWQPSRLSFDSGAHCGPGIVQRRPAPTVYLADAAPLSFADLVPAGSPPPRPIGQKTSGKPATTAHAINCARHNLTEALIRLPADDYQTWVYVGLALKSGRGEDGWPIWRDWSATAANADPIGVLRAKWDGFMPDGTSAGDFAIAKRAFRYGYLDDMVHRVAAQGRAILDRAPATWLPADQPAPMPPMLDQAAASEKLQKIARHFVGEVIKWVAGDRKSPAPIIGVEGTTGLAKTKIIKDFIIPELQKADIPERFLGALKRDAEEMAAATDGYWRRGREDCRPLAPDVPDVAVFALYPHHCPRADAAHKLAEQNHQAHQNICLTCAHGAKRQARIAQERDQGEAAIAGHLLHAQRLGAVEGLQLSDLSDRCWLDHQQAATEELTETVTAQGACPPDFAHAVEGKAVLIADESLTLTHTATYTAGDIMDALQEIQAHSSVLKIALNSAFCAGDDRAKREEELAIFNAIDEKYQTISASLSQHADTGGAVVEIGADKGKTLSSCQQWEQPEKDESRAFGFAKIPRRAAAEISRMSTYRILDGKLVVTYSSAMADTWGNYPLFLADATMPQITKLKIAESGGQVIKIAAKQNATVIRDNRLFDGALRKIDGKIDEFEAGGITERLFIVATERREEAKKIGLKGAFLICKKEKAIRLLAMDTGLSLAEINDLDKNNKPALWSLSIARGIGWWGWHDKSHNEWAGFMPVILDTPSIDRKVFFPLAYENHRAAMADIGVDLPAYDNKWVDGQWITTGNFMEMSAGGLPETPAIRDFFLSLITAQVTQAIGRARLIWHPAIDRVYTYSGYPALLNKYGLAVEYEKMSITRVEKSAVNQAMATAASMRACAEIAQSGEQITRERVENHMRAQDVGVAHSHYSAARAALAPALASAFAARGPGAGAILQARLEQLGGATQDAINAINHLFNAAGRDLARLRALVAARLANLPDAADAMAQASRLLADLLDSTAPPVMQ